MCPIKIKFVITNKMSHIKIIEKVIISLQVRCVSNEDKPTSDHGEKGRGHCQVFIEHDVQYTQMSW